MDISSIIKNLKLRREIFHSEADFQHELAWEIRQSYSNYSIRLEKPFDLDERIYVDIYFYNSSKIAIEVKYKTQNFNYTFNNKENFKLTTHSAINLGRYDYLKDIERLEKLKSKKLINIGYAIFLTNAPSYWKRTSKSSILSKDFYIAHSDKLDKNEYKWLSDVKETSIGKKRKQRIKLSKNYNIDWKNYSNIDNNEFKILILKI